MHGGDDEGFHLSCSRWMILEKKFSISVVDMISPESGDSVNQERKPKPNALGKRRKRKG